MEVPAAGQGRGRLLGLVGLPAGRGAGCASRSCSCRRTGDRPLGRDPQSLGPASRGTVTAESTAKRPVSSDTEYFCPMDPGVVSDWPGRCGVCNMALVRRKRGDAVMLPDGVVARMQLSPYRIQLAGIQTAPLGYRPLHREWSVAGLVTRDRASAAAANVVVDVPGRQVPWVEQGQPVEVACTDLPGQETLAGWVRSLVRGVEDGREFAHVTVAIDTASAIAQGGHGRGREAADCRGRARAVPRMPRNPPARKAGRAGRAFTSVTTIRRRSLWSRSVARSTARIGCRRRWASSSGWMVVSDASGRHGRQGGWCMRPVRRDGACSRRWSTMHRQAQVLAVPQSAVVDTGARKVVFVESMPGMFDGVEVVLGPRCGDYYPVVRGLEPGQNIAIAGAFLLDAETRLNPSLAAGYFGAGRGDRRVAATGPSPGAGRDSSTPADVLDGLALEDRALAERQKICPVTGMALGSMGAPQR